MTRRPRSPCRPRLSVGTRSHEVYPPSLARSPSTFAALEDLPPVAAAAALGLLEAAAEPTEGFEVADAFGASPLARRAATGELGSAADDDVSPSRNWTDESDSDSDSDSDSAAAAAARNFASSPTGPPPTPLSEPASRRRRRVPRARRRRRRRTRALSECFPTNRSGLASQPLAKFASDDSSDDDGLGLGLWLGPGSAASCSPRRARVNSSDNSSSSSTTAAVRLADSVLAVIGQHPSPDPRGVRAARQSWRRCARGHAR